jgi:DNA-binding NtrC family response regulator
LEQAVRDSRFREDLYYRLNIIRIFIPPLRERPEDLDILLDHFAGQFADRIERPLFEFTEGARDFLRQYSWPGNVRELKNTVERLMILGDWRTVKQELMARETKQMDGHEITVQPSPPLPKDAEVVPEPRRKFPPLKEVKKKAVQEAEGRLIGEVLRETDWNRKRAAKLLQISYKALLYKIKELNLRRED